MELLPKLPISELVMDTFMWIKKLGRIIILLRENRLNFNEKLNIIHFQLF